MRSPGNCVFYISMSIKDDKLLLFYNLMYTFDRPNKGNFIEFDQHSSSYPLAVVLCLTFVFVLRLNLLLSVSYLFLLVILGKVS